MCCLSAIIELSLIAFSNALLSSLGLQASLLVRHPETRKLFVNFDPQLVQMMRETEYMTKMGLSIPEAARLMYLRQDQLKQTADDLQVCALWEDGQGIYGMATK